MKKILTLILCVCTLSSLFACAPKSPGTVYAEITMENGGKITLELYGDIAPITVNNFIKHASDGTYDGTIFHRVIKGFMIQGGDPTGTGAGDPTISKIKGEFAANGIENNIKHERGVISMARANDMNSASTQFFICDSNSASVKSLDGKYAAFGRVLAGMDVVDTIAATATNPYNDRPLKSQKIESVKIIDKESADAAVAAEKAALSEK